MTKLTVEKYTNHGLSIDCRYIQFHQAKIYKTIEYSDFINIDLNKKG